MSWGTPRGVLVTGGCGFIGSNFINFIFDKWSTARFVNYDRLSIGASQEHVLPAIRLSPRYTFVHADLSEPEKLEKCLKENEIDVVIHFAAITHVDESYARRVDTIRDNILSTTYLLESLRDYKSLRRFIHISTDEVYGDSIADSAPKTEETTPNPTNPYAASKAACELIIQSYHHSYKLPFVMVRMNNVYGPRQAKTKLIPKFTQLAIDGEPYPLMGDGLHTRSWMYVDDCSEAIKRVSEQGEIGQIYNIGVDFEMSNIDVTRRIHSLVSKLLQRPPSEPTFVAVPDRPYHDRRYLIDFSKVTSATGWRCETPFDDGLVRTVEYYVNDYKKSTRIQG